ncbi:AlpA family phage regulatory protein [Sphingobium sp. CFD-1]|uniref:AlpA family phage regulatory protein n=1 Tax=Sphingobium sp. CFD-1 TaxID=2878545 RepID=UPI00214B40B0|nr:AlpA family phage regulatory protein [Sphingobium sp. CFD-1]
MNEATERRRDNLLRLVDVMRLTNLTAGDITARQIAGDFPQGVKIGPRSTRWSEQEIIAWLATKPSLCRAYVPSLRAPKGYYVNEAALVRHAPAYTGRHMSVDRLREFAVPIADMMHGGTGLYFLWRGDSVVYVGQTRAGFLRIATHMSNTGMAFDAVGFLRCPSSELDAAERAYIDRLLPEYNRDPITMKAKRALSSKAKR